MAIAWLYRDDYGKAGFTMLPVVEPEGRRTARHALVYTIALCAMSVGPTVAGVSGVGYLACASALGLVLLWLAARFMAERNDATARALFFATITYLPLVWIAMIVDKR